MKHSSEKNLEILAALQENITPSFDSCWWYRKYKDYSWFGTLENIISSQPWIVYDWHHDFLEWCLSKNWEWFIMIEQDNWLQYGSLTRFNTKTFETTMVGWWFWAFGKRTWAAIEVEWFSLGDYRYDVSLNKIYSNYYYMDNMLINEKWCLIGHDFTDDNKKIRLDDRNEERCDDTYIKILQWEKARQLYPITQWEKKQSSTSTKKPKQHSSDTIEKKSNAMRIQLQEKWVLRAYASLTQEEKYLLILPWDNCEEKDGFADSGTYTYCKVYNYSLYDASTQETLPLWKWLWDQKTLYYDSLHSRIIIPTHKPMQWNFAPLDIYDANTLKYIKTLGAEGQWYAINYEKKIFSLREYVNNSQSIKILGTRDLLEEGL